MNQVLVQQAWVGSQDGVQLGVRHHGSRRGDLQHPEDSSRLGVLLRLADGRRETAERRRHPLQGLIQRRRLVQVYPCHSQMRSVRKPVVGQLATLERARQGHVVAVQHIITVS